MQQAAELHPDRADLVVRWYKDDSTVHAVLCQVFSYMVNAGVGFGVLTAVEHTWLLRRSVDAPSTLQVSSRTGHVAACTCLHEWPTKSKTTSEALRPWVLSHTCRWHAGRQGNTGKYREVHDVTCCHGCPLCRCHGASQLALMAADVRPSLLCAVRCSSCSSWLSLQAGRTSRPCP
jgi:hypothetical protein